VVAGIGAAVAVSAATASSPRSHRAVVASPVSLNVWYYNESGPDVKFMKLIVKKFESLHPDVKINLTVYPENNYTTKVDTALAVNQAPDIGDMYTRQWMKAGKFLSLNSAIKNEHIDLKTFNKGLLSYCSMGGKIYCLGSYAGAVVMFYNKSMFRAAGLRFPPAAKPLTIQQYAHDAARLTNHA
jgi:ABC-type glycerol-3-phosphate transport system substrate-binding protein